MKLIKKNIRDLKEAKYNPRKKLTVKDKEYQNIKRSIEKFGYVEPIIVNKDNTIIGGHQRYSVLKDLEYEEVDVIQVDLSKIKEKALNIALNKISGEWNQNKLIDLLTELQEEDFDITLTGFDKFDLNLDVNLLIDEPEEKENERIRTMNTYNLELFNYESSSKGFWEMPIIENNNCIPTDLIGFNYAKTNNNKNCGIHFYLDDYQFERLWNNPAEYIDILKEYECILSPDFSLYMDMPTSMKIWNIYRSRLIGQFYQRQGIKVIPTISWAEIESFDYCFQGIPKGSIVSISTIGVKKNKNALAIWEDGVNEMIKQIEPSTIIVYGGKVDCDFKNINVIYIDNKVTEKMKNIKAS
nr:MAG TPA: adenine specific DNA methyltransferase [Caudoviricetes sp.]